MKTHETGFRVLASWSGTAPVLVVGVFACCLALNHSAAAEETLPKAEAILDRFVEVTGGKTAYERLRNRVTVAKVSISNSTTQGTATTYQAAPDRLRTTLEYPARGKNERGFDGKVAWEYHAKRGVRIVNGEERASAVRNATFHADAHWRELFTKVETLGIETVDGRECYKLRLTPRDEKPLTHFFDKETGLRTKMVVPFFGPKGDVSLEVLYGDYKEIDGIRFPHETRHRAVKQEQVFTLEKIEHNVDLPSDRFDLPIGIKSLLEQSDEKPANSKPEP